MKNVTAVFLAILSLPIPSFAWGPKGHRIVADIARERLTRSARQQIRELLGDDDLAAISTWADDIRNQRPETSGWHFVDIPWQAQGFSEERDCYHPDAHRAYSLEDHHNCVVDRIELFRRILGDKHGSISNRAEALKFLVHFVADVHQPLHAIAQARGGNEINVIEFGRRECGSRLCNFHYVWDIALIEHSGRTESGYVLRLNNLIARTNMRIDASDRPETWANESFWLARQIWLEEGGLVDEAYYQRTQWILDSQLARAGLRLASVLNQTFAP